METDAEQGHVQNFPLCTFMTDWQISALFNNMACSGRDGCEFEHHLVLMGVDLRFRMLLVALLGVAGALPP